MKFEIGDLVRSVYSNRVYRVHAKLDDYAGIERMDCKDLERGHICTFIERYIHKISALETLIIESGETGV